MSESPQGVLRNLTAYGDVAFSGYMRRTFLASAGYDRDDLSRPIVGIADTRSDYNTCHRDVPQIVDAVRRGVLEAGGLPMVFPTCSLHEINFSPTTMLFRNLLAMETEELIRAQPMDAVVLVGGCDKTLPAQLMGAASANVPALCVVTGPMRAGSFRGERLGACTDCRRLWHQHRAGRLDETEIEQIEQHLCSSGGTCMVMGTATSMACITEAMGMMLSGGAVAPSGSGARLRHAAASGRRAVDLARQPERFRPKQIMTRAAFLNGLTVLMALGGSTNVIVHLPAIARRCGVALTLDDVQDAADRVPLLVDCKPAGAHYAEDLHHAGGAPALLKALEPMLDRATRSVAGDTLGDLLDHFDPPGSWQRIVHPLSDPLGPTGALTVLRGSLAPDGAIIKSAAATEALCRHAGPALVFESVEDVTRRIDDPGLAVTANHVLVMRHAGPVGAGMPEAGGIPIPKVLSRRGVNDMVRISDARMSGTAYGTVVLHCSPEAAVGGPLALVRDGDMIDLDVSRRRLDLRVDKAEMAQRRAALRPPEKPNRGWRRLFAEHVLQAHEGADLDFLAGES
ncbi:MAG: dihydroxy-acid dehydratase [Phycisphaeraceae bacterium]|nr:dihydroxy-acid dehydratase [Phycisphaeraceae bacterium]